MKNAVLRKSPVLSDMVFGALRESELREVRRIERKCYRSPWPTVLFKDLISDPYHDFLAGRLGRKLVAYAGYERKGNTAHIINFSVHPDYRRLGVGTLTMERLLDTLAAQGLETADLEVRETNVPAQLFYRKAGFLACEVIDGYYFDTGEEAIVMKRELNNRGDC